MDKGFDSTSITVLQNELGMSRGALYRHFKNKDELFRSVIDEYFFRIFNRFLAAAEKNRSLLEMIDFTVRFQKLLLGQSDNLSQTAFLNFTALMIQAAKHYPGFMEKFGRMKTGIYDCWKKAICHDIRCNKIRKDINVNIIAGFFNDTGLKESTRNSNNELFKNHIITNIHEHRKALLYLYDLIKV